MFQTMMENVLFQKHKALGLQEFSSIYIDDLLITTLVGQNFDECLKKHNEQVRKVLGVLRQEKHVCAPKKGKMFLQSVELCGSILENGTRRPAPGKMAALQLWERPKPIPQLRAFPGCCNVYHEFLPLYAKYSGPLKELLRVGKVEGRKGSQVKLKWTPECEEAFTGLKDDSGKCGYIKDSAVRRMTFLYSYRRQLLRHWCYDGTSRRRRSPSPSGVLVLQAYYKTAKLESKGTRSPCNPLCPTAL